MSSAQWNDPNTAEGEDISSSVVSYTKESLEIIQEKDWRSFHSLFFSMMPTTNVVPDRVTAVEFPSQCRIETIFSNLFITNPQFHEIKDFWIIH